MRFTSLFTIGLILGIAAALPAQAQSPYDTPLGQLYLALAAPPDAATTQPGAGSAAPEARVIPVQSLLPRQPTSPQSALARQPSGGFFGWFQRQALSSKLRRQVVQSPYNYKPGTIVINTKERFLYHIQGDGTAMRYGIGVGRQGFSWGGSAYVGDKREWPGWTPPPAMRKREPWLPAHMPGGPENPLGARALYLYKGGKDTLYRIHGTNQPETIGQAVSSGCIRLLNEDVEYLYERVSRGAKVVVL